MYAPHSFSSTTTLYSPPSPPLPHKNTPSRPLSIRLPGLHPPPPRNQSHRPTFLSGSFSLLSNDKDKRSPLTSSPPSSTKSGFPLSPLPTPSVTKDVLLVNTQSDGWPRWTQTTTFWLLLYFFFNLSLTLYNKFVLISFPYPYTLTALHALSSTIGTYTLRSKGYFKPAKVSRRQNILLLAFSVLYTVNIAVSNISLSLVTIPFHQVVRSTTPLFTLFLSVLVLGTGFSTARLVSLIPVVAGVGLATFGGSYQFTLAGLLLTLLGTILASIKTISTNLLQTSSSSGAATSNNCCGFRLTSKLHPLDLLMRMSPLAFVQCIIYAYTSGELSRIMEREKGMGNYQMAAIVANGLIAFGLNVVSFTANKKSGALTMTVAANVKQVLTILLAVMIFNLSLSPTNAMGIVLTLVGGGCYGMTELRESQLKSQQRGVGVSLSQKHSPLLVVPESEELQTTSTTSSSNENTNAGLVERVTRQLKRTKSELIASGSFGFSPSTSTSSTDDSSSDSEISPIGPTRLTVKNTAQYPAPSSAVGSWGGGHSWN